jgi:nucleoid-associated protein YgaU
MTKETKIGLLVGLAFIILFAIILSEKSGTRDAALPQFANADAARKIGTATGSEKPLYNAGRLPVDSKLPPPIETRPAPVKTVDAARPAADQAPSGKSQSQALETESLARLLNPPEETADNNTDKPKEVPSVSLGEAVAIALDSAPTPVVPKAEPPAEKTAAALKPVEAAPDLTLTEPLAAAPAKETPSKPASALPIKATHEVQAGESLGKIAAKYYGRSTPQRVEAIYNANRDVLPSVHAVKASTKLNIPDLGENNDQFEAVQGFSGTQLVDARKAGFDDRVIVPLPIGDRMQPRERQRGSGSMDRAAPAASEKATAEKATAEKATAEKATVDKAPPEKKGVTEKVATAAQKEAPEKAKTGKPVTELKPEKPAKADKPATEKSKAEKDAPDTKYEWYEVRQSDTLGKIAAKRLGGQKFYSEILRLNKDRINDKNVLKPGVKIRLPVKVASGSPAGGERSASDLAEP